RANLEHPLFVVVPADRDHRQAGLLDRKQAGGLDAVHLRHLDVHHDGVDHQAPRERDGLAPVAGAAGDLEAPVCAHYGLERRREGLVVFGDEDPIDALIPQNAPQASGDRAGPGYAVATVSCRRPFACGLARSWGISTWKVEPEAPSDSTQMRPSTRRTSSRQI